MSWRRPSCRPYPGRACPQVLTMLAFVSRFQCYVPRTLQRRTSSVSKYSVLLCFCRIVGHVVLKFGAFKRPLCVFSKSCSLPSGDPWFDQCPLPGAAACRLPPPRAEVIDHASILCRSLASHTQPSLSPLQHGILHFAG